MCTDESEEVSESEADVSEDDDYRHKKRVGTSLRSRKGTVQADEYSDVEDYSDNEDAVNTHNKQLDLQNNNELLTSTSTPIHIHAIKSIQVRRVLLEKLIDQPYLPDYIRNMFAQVTVGSKPDGTVAYRLGQIMDIQQLPSDKKYEFPLKSRKYITSALLLRHGNNERLFPYTTVSNSSISEKEFIRWKTAVDSATQSNNIITVEQANLIKRNAEKLRTTYVYTPEILQQMHDSKRATQSAGNINHATLTIEKIRIKQLLDQLIDEDIDGSNNEQISQLQLQYQTLCDVEQKKRIKQSANSNQLIADANQRIRQQHTNEINSMRIQAKLLQQSGAQTVFDPFKRTITRPGQMTFDNNSSPEKQIRTIDNEEKDDTSNDRNILSIDTLERQISNDDLDQNNNNTNNNIITMHPRQIILPKQPNTLNDKLYNTVKQSNYNNRVTNTSTVISQYRKPPRTATTTISLADYWARADS